MKLDGSWWLLLPLLLSVFYGYTQSRTKGILHSSAGQGRASWPVTTLAVAGLMLGWAEIGFPLPFFYILVYLLQALHLLNSRPASVKSWFLLNLNYANSLALHLILIGVAALLQKTTMHALLDSSFWRTISVSVVLLVVVIQDLCFLLLPNLASALLTEAESQEAGPFMAFLWFCAGYLLIDSTLCVFELEPVYPPLFLISSSVVVIFTLIRFLLHIHTLIKNNHLEKEHDMLSSQLEATEVSAGYLQQMVERDVLTGAYSRRYALERMDTLLQAESPFSLVFLDLDALKKINDTQGHDAGDAYLISFVETLEGRLRDCDLLARVGGDEFIVLMPGCAAEAATQRIQEIRSALEQVRQGEATFRFSYGVTACPDGIRDGERLIHEADQAMYRDKAQRHREEGRL